MVWLEALVASVMGAAALSFTQLTVDRAVPTSVGLLGRSCCPGCKAQLAARDVLPVVGFVLLRGRCRKCRAPIPRRHLAGELTVAALWAATVVALGLSVWLPLVLIAPLVGLLARSPVRDTRGVAAGLFPPLGLALLTSGVLGLSQGDWQAYGAGGLLGASALLAGALAARTLDDRALPLTGG